MKKYFILIYILIALVQISAAQVKQIIPELNVGDHIPDIVLNHMIGADDGVKLADFNKQDLLIINFWATWCAPCLKEMQTFNDITARFDGKVRVLAVAYEKEPTIKSFLKNHSEIKTKNLVITTDDTVLIRYFRHRILPHNIWVDRNGIVKYITGAEALNDEKINDFIIGKPLQAQNKLDVLHFDSFEPFHLRDSDFTYRSIFSSHTQGINGGQTFQGVWGHPNDNWLKRVFLFNESRQQILWVLLYGNLSDRDYYGQLKIETKDSTRFFWPKQCPKSFKQKYNDELKWRSENAFCFEMSLPNAVPDSILYSYMLEDFKRINRVEVTKVMSKIPTCILKLSNKRQFKKAINDSSYIDITPKGLKMHNSTLLNLFQYLNEKAKSNPNAKPLDPPYINETGIDYRVDLELNFKKVNPTYQDVKDWLMEKYGFSYLYKTRPYPSYLVKDLVQ